jgi:hypothetical protein
LPRAPAVASGRLERIVFVLARIVFWIGYRKDPLLRAPGMAATAYLNLGGLLTAVYLAFVQ